MNFPSVTSIEHDGDGWNVELVCGQRYGTGHHFLLSVAMYIAMWSLIVGE